jgi:uncharacterized oxidoreductase
MDTRNDTILITGGGTGIGKAMAEALHARGARVIIAGRRREPLEAVAAANPGMAFETLDVADPTAIEAFASRIVEAHPDLNVVINNAGIMIPEDLTAEPVDPAIAEQTIAINLLGPIRLTTALLPHLKRKTAATVVNVTSGLAFVPLTSTPVYSATKAALRSWSQSLRHQLGGTAVEVLEWAPPAVATDLVPGHAENPNSMPLADFTAESLALFEAGGTDEILVERVKFLSGAEARGEYDSVFEALNGAR